MSDCFLSIQTNIDARSEVSKNEHKTKIRAPNLFGFSRQVGGAKLFCQVLDFLNEYVAQKLTRVPKEEDARGKFRTVGREALAVQIVAFGAHSSSC